MNTRQIKQKKDLWMSLIRACKCLSDRLNRRKKTSTSLKLLLTRCMCLRIKTRGPMIMSAWCRKLRVSIRGLRLRANRSDYRTWNLWTASTRWHPLSLNTILTEAGCQAHQKLSASSKHSTENPSFKWGRRSIFISQFSNQTYFKILRKKNLKEWWKNKQPKGQCLSKFFLRKIINK